MNSPPFLSVNKDNPVLPVSQQIALVLFYRLEQCQDLANIYSKSNELIKSLTLELKKAMKDILQQTQSTLKQRGFLRGSVVMGSNVSKLVDMIVGEGSRSCFCQYFVRYHCGQNKTGLKDEDLITFYNKIMDLWSQSQNSKIQQLKLEFNLLEPPSNLNSIANNFIKEAQIQCNHQQNSYTLPQSIDLYSQKSITDPQFYRSIKTSSNASLQFLKQFTSDLRPVDPTLIQNINYKKTTKTIAVLDSQEPTLNFQYYDDVGKVLIDVFLVAVDHKQVVVKQDEF